MSRSLCSSEKPEEGKTSIRSAPVGGRIIVLKAGRAERNYWSDVWRYRERFAILDRCHVAVRCKQTMVGVAWASPRASGTALLQATACGLPVIACNLDVSVDALAEGALATLIEPSDASQLVTALCGMFDRCGVSTIPASCARFDGRHFNAHVDDLVRSFR